MNIVRLLQTDDKECLFNMFCIAYS